MLCILAVFMPSFFMEGAARALFVPLALAVGFAMVTSYFLSSTFVPVLSVWLLRHYHQPHESEAGRFSFTRLRDAYTGLLRLVVALRWIIGAGLPGGRWVADLAGRRAAGAGDLSHCGCRPVPASPAGADGHPDRMHRATGGQGTGGNQAKGGTGQCRHLGGLRRPDPVELSHQHGVSCG